MPARVFEFGGFKLDCDRFELTRAGRSRRLERKPMELLILLVEADGRLVNREEIAQRLWESEVFVDTEHGINTVIRKIRQVLGDDPENPRFIQTVDGHGLPIYSSTGRRESAIRCRVGVSAQSDETDLRSPSAALASSAELQEPNSEARQEFSSCPNSAAQRAADRLANPRSGGGGCLAADRGCGGPRTFLDRLLHRGAKPAIHSLAVLPLDNLSGDANQEYFADGMTDELITMLAKDSTLRVTSRTSVMQYKNAHRPLREIANELGVDGIVEGSIAHTGNQVHMTIQLIQVSTDTHIWAESYDRDANDIASLPREAAVAIAKRLDRAVPQAAGPRYVNPEAHDAYLRGRYLWFRGRNEEAGKYFRKAVEMQADYAAGWAGLSSYYGEGAGDGNLDPSRLLPEAEADARKAVDLDNESSEAHLTLGATIRHSAIGIRTYDSKRFRGPCTARSSNILSSSTSAPGYSACSAVIRRPSRPRRLQPRSILSKGRGPWWATMLDEAREYDAAIKEARQRLQADPNMDMFELVALAYRGKGMPREWARAYEQHLRLAGDLGSAAAVEHAFKRGGQKAVVRWQIDQLEHKSKTGYVSPVALALLHAQLGDKEKTLALFEAGYREHSPLLLSIQLDPAYDFLHADGTLPLDHQTNRTSSILLNLGR